MANKESSLITVGWREWVRLPEMGVRRIKAKIDTGARSSSLHAYDIEVVDSDDGQLVKFKVQPLQKNRDRVIEARLPVHEFRKVRSSNGQTTTRPVVRTTLVMLDQRFEIDLTLFDRTKMGFRMLIGREALVGRFIVDAERSFCGGKPKKKIAGKVKGNKK